MADLDFKITWASGAHSDFRKILEYISDDNPEASVRVGEAIMARINQLKSQPRMGSRIPEEPTHESRQLVQGNYRIIYQVDESSRCIDIIRIWHGARGEVGL